MRRSEQPISVRGAVKGLTTTTWPYRRGIAGTYAVANGIDPFLPSTPEDVERAFREFAHDLNKAANDPSSDHPIDQPFSEPGGHPGLQYLATGLLTS